MLCGRGDGRGGLRHGADDCCGHRRGVDAYGCSGSGARSSLGASGSSSTRFNISAGRGRCWLEGAEDLRCGRIDVDNSVSFNEYLFEALGCGSSSFISW
jgi:hypothetical protein